MREARRRVVVVGAGFAGLRAVHRLASGPVDVTLVDRHDYNTFQPLLYQVATAGLDEGGVAHTIRAIFADDANVEVQLGTVVGIDFTNRAVALEDGGSLDYDALVLAAGATTNDFEVPGVTEFAFPLYTLSEAIDLRQHVLTCFEEHRTGPGAGRRGSAHRGDRRRWSDGRRDRRDVGRAVHQGAPEGVPAG